MFYHEEHEEARRKRNAGFLGDETILEKHALCWGTIKIKIFHHEGHEENKGFTTKNTKKHEGEKKSRV